MASTSAASWKIYWFVFKITLVIFPIALLVCAFSFCEVRKRSEKQACRGGDVARCVEVGKYYEAKADGILGFLMSHADTAIANYYRACKLKSSVGCERMVYMLGHSEQARNLSTEQTDMADALIDACGANVTDACTQLFTFMDQGDWVAKRSAMAFEQRCNTTGEGQACFILARLHVLDLGGEHNVLEEVLALYDKACKGGIADGCNGAQIYRAAQARRAAQSSGTDATGSGASGSAATGSGSAR